MSLFVAVGMISRDVSLSAIIHSWLVTGNLRVSCHMWQWRRHCESYCSKLHYEGQHFHIRSLWLSGVCGIIADVWAFKLLFFHPPFYPSKQKACYGVLVGDAHSKLSLSLCQQNTRNFASIVARFADNKNPLSSRSKIHNILVLSIVAHQTALTRLFRVCEVLTSYIVDWMQCRLSAGACQSGFVRKWT